MEGILIFVVITAVVMGIQFVVKNNRKKTWMALGAELDLQFIEGGFFSYPKLVGEYRGVPVKIDVEVRGRGKHKQVYTRVAADVPAILPGGLAVSKEGLLSGVGKFFGSQDIEVGDDSFDGACMIKGETPSEVIRLFQDRSAKDAVWELVHAGTEGSLSSGRAKVLTHGVSSNGATLRMHLDTVVDVAQKLAAAVGSPVRELAADDDWKAVAEIESTPPLSAPIPSILEPESKPAPQPKVIPFNVPEPTPAAAPPLSTPEPAAAPPTRGDDLQKLADKSLGYSDRQRVIDALKVAPLDVILTVEKTERTSALGLDDSYRGGLTVIGTVGELSVGVRYPNDRNASLEALPEGATLPVSAEFIDFDDFYRRAILQA
ncbi:MAG: hypothetical protein GY913_03690 [Proteobacteria bacterium]|nr:hypothetical protein [Pseudomonadota bacterium]MCP4916004.1 hypothetical protein [Pseudomonadota bacterium]